MKKVLKDMKLEQNTLLKGDVLIMNKNIIDFEDIKAGWMNMIVYDYMSNANRKMRISYIQPFFDDLLMACKFLLSDITGIYTINIDQEGFEAKISLYKYQSDTISMSIEEEFFEDELPYNGEIYYNPNQIPTTLFYFSVDVEIFINNIISLIEKHKKQYNDGFVMCPSDKLNTNLLNQVKQKYNNKCCIRKERK